jgi:hypothetical protein
MTVENPNCNTTRLNSSDAVATLRNVFAIAFDFVEFKDKLNRFILNAGEHRRSSAC